MNSEVIAKVKSAIINLQDDLKSIGESLTSATDLLSMPSLDEQRNVEEFDAIIKQVKSSTEQVVSRLESLQNREYLSPNYLLFRAEIEAMEKSKQVK